MSQQAEEHLKINNINAKLLVNQDSGKKFTFTFTSEHSEHEHVIPEIITGKIHAQNNRSEPETVVCSVQNDGKFFEVDFKNYFPHQAVRIILPFCITLKKKKGYTKTSYLFLIKLERTKEDAFSYTGVTEPTDSDQYYPEELTKFDLKKRKNHEQGSSKRKVLRKGTDDESLSTLLREKHSILEKETNLFNRLKESFENREKPAKDKFGDIYKKHISDIENLLKELNSEITITFFAKPGFGKSYIINLLVTGFKTSEYPLPSSVKLGSGLTKFVIELRYNDKYSIEKQFCTEIEQKFRKINNINTSFRYEPLDELQGNVVITEILERAYLKITEYLESSSDEHIYLKKLIVNIPSDFLKDANIILRDIPGYEENEDMNLLIRESLFDTNLLFFGPENDRGIVDQNIVDKIVSYGFFQNKRVSQFLAMIINNQHCSGNADTLKLNFQQDTLHKVKMSLSDYFDIELDGVESNKESINIEKAKQISEIADLPEFLTRLKDNFRICCTPLQTDSSACALFQSNFKEIVEKVRRSIIDQKVETIKNLAITILSSIKSPVHKDTLRSNFSDLFKLISNTMIKQMKKKKPTYRNVSDIVLETFVSKLVSCYKYPILKMVEHYDRKDIEGMASKNKLGKGWKVKFPELFKMFDTILNAFKTQIENKAELLEQEICEIIGKRFDKSTCAELIRNIVDEINSPTNSTDDSQFVRVRTKISDFEKEVDLEIEIFQESVDHIALIDCPKDLQEHYLRKKFEGMSNISLDASLPEVKFQVGGPLQLPKNIELTTSTSGNIELLPEFKFLQKNKFLHSHDRSVALGIRKYRKYEIEVEANYSDKEGNENIMTITLNQNKLFLEFNRKMELDPTLLTLSIPKQKKNEIPTHIKPVFIMTRPRGEDWSPNLFYDSVKLLKSDNIKYLFVIVTEKKFFDHYKKMIEENGLDVNDYWFLLLDSLQTFGPARVHSSILAVAQYLKLTCIHILHDDIAKFFEYSQKEYSYCSYDTSMIRALMLLEKVLAYEIYNVGDFEESKKLLENFLIKDEKLDNLHDSIMDSGIDVGLSKKSFSLARSFLRETEKQIKQLIEDPTEILNLMEQIGTEKAQEIKTRIEQILKIGRKDHIGRVSLSKKKKEFEKTLHHFRNRPTHTINYSTSSVNTYYLPSIKNIYPIEESIFWQKPIDEAQRKKKIEEWRVSKKEKQREKELIEHGWKLTDINERSQMLLNGVGGFFVFRFSYSKQQTAPKDINYLDLEDKRENHDTGIETIEILDDEVMTEAEDDELTEKGLSQ